MAYPTVVVNNSTGSNTAASGAPSGFAAISGTAAATAASTTVTLSVDAPDLSGVAVDGSAAIWVDSSSGRQWSKITAVDNILKTVTVETAYANTESGKNWGIGGKRLTLAGSTRLGLDVLGGWTIDIEEAGTDYVLTTAFVVSPALVAGLRCTITCSTATDSDSVRPVITTSTNGVHIFNVSSSLNVTISNLKLTSTAGTRGQGIVPVSGHCSYLTVRNCVLDGFNNGLEFSNITFFSTTGLVVEECEILNCTRDGISHSGSVANSGTIVSGCNIHDNTENGIKNYGSVETRSLMVFRSRIMDNGSNGVLTNGSPTTIAESRLAGNTLSGVLASAGSAMLLLQNNIFWGNTRYGVEGATSVNQCGGGYNAFGDNGLGARLVFTALPGDFDITVDPSVLEPSDSDLNGTAGGGADCVGAGGPQTFVGQADTLSAPDVGAVQSEGGAAPTNTTLVFGQRITNILVDR